MNKVEKRQESLKQFVETNYGDLHHVEFNCNGGFSYGNGFLVFNPENNEWNFQNGKIGGMYTVKDSWVLEVIWENREKICNYLNITKTKLNEMIDKSFLEI